jgi:hypothetical protein
MKAIILTIYRDSDGVSSVLTKDGEFMDRREMTTLLKDLQKFYQGMSDHEIERYIEYAKNRKTSNSRGRDKNGYVYLIKSYDDFFKIGQAINPRTRLAGFQMPYKPKIIHTIPVTDMDWSERYLHRKFAHKRVDGEWFVLDSKDVAYIKSLTSLEPSD